MAETPPRRSVPGVAFQELMEVTNRLLTNAQGLAAFAARLRLDELGVAGRPGRAGAARPGDRTRLAPGSRYKELGEGERSVLLAQSRAPTWPRRWIWSRIPVRAGAWSYADPVLLEAQGSASAIGRHA